eukprot:Skav220038  [mRNA]  locus=scaffold2981:229450:237281:+ [translate_table: standard]
MFYLKTAKKTREVLSDYTATRILDNMRPLLKQGKVYRNWGDYFTLFILSIVLCCHLPQILAGMLIIMAFVLGILLYPLAKLADAMSACWSNLRSTSAQKDLERIQHEMEKDEFDQTMCLEIIDPTTDAVVFGDANLSFALNLARHRDWNATKLEPKDIKYYSL